MYSFPMVIVNTPHVHSAVTKGMAWETAFQNAEKKTSINIDSSLLLKKKKNRL